jgi:hypothetical protein
MPYPSADAAVKALDSGEYKTSPYYKTLMGSWGFHFSPNPESRPKAFYETDFDVSGWSDIDVPCNWQIWGYRNKKNWDIPIYSNKLYPFKKNPPFVMGEPPKNWPMYRHRNPVGSYVRDFTVPKTFSGRKTTLHFSGAGSAYYVWVNGKFVGIVNLRLLDEKPATYKAVVVKLGQGMLGIQGEVSSNQYLWYRGGDTIGVYDLNWNKMKDLPVRLKNFAAVSGENILQVWVREKDPVWMDVQFFVKDTPLIIK